MALTDVAVRKAMPKAKQYKLSDSFGLYLLVKPNGSKLWRYDYVFDGKRKTASLGAYPSIGLAAARAARDDVKRSLAGGADPVTEKRLARIADAVARGNSFGAIADEYLQRMEDRDPPAAPATLAKTRWILNSILGRDFRERPIADITSAEVLVVLQRIERSGRRETAGRVRSVISAVFRLAITTLRAQNDPTYVLRDALLPPKVTNMAAITDEVAFGRLLTAIDEYDGWPTLRLAMQFSALTFCRPGEIRAAQWEEFDLPGQRWTIPALRTKTRRPHAVPLSRQAIAVLDTARSLELHSPLVFPSIRSNRKPLSENAINSALRRMGYTKHEMTAHGFRSSASSILNGRGFDPEIIEMCLAHVDGNRIRAIYNRSERWEERMSLMQKWANILDNLKVL